LCVSTFIFSITRTTFIIIDFHNMNDTKGDEVLQLEDAGDTLVSFSRFHSNSLH
jgi:hypothetical protein